MKTTTVMLRTLANGKMPPNPLARTNKNAGKRLANAKVIIGRMF
jgi:hypothetical protein|tara:strand:+ start:1774 stop:1905 length:132 start_codon:yes stop_codon:yes gene_type:complete